MKDLISCDVEIVSKVYSLLRDFLNYICRSKLHTKGGYRHWALRTSDQISTA